MWMAVAPLKHHVAVNGCMTMGRGIFKYVWIPLDSCGYLWLTIVVSDCKEISVYVEDCLWMLCSHLRMNVSECEWLWVTVPAIICMWKSLSDRECVGGCSTHLWELVAACFSWWAPECLWVPEIIYGFPVVRCISTMTLVVIWSEDPRVLVNKK